MGTKIVQNWLLSFFVILLFLVIAEIGLRLAWIRPYHPIPYQIECAGGTPYLPHARLGFDLHPGSFDITINEMLPYHATHTEAHTRRVGPLQEADQRWALFGCSFTYGMGVDDSYTFAARLQRSHPEIALQNYAGPAYSQVHALLQLRELAEKNQFPDRVLITYLSFHDRRNALIRKQRQDFRTAFENAEESSKVSFSKAAYPYARLQDDQLSILYLPMDSMYRHFPLRRRSSIVNLAENAYNNFREITGDQAQITESLFREIKAICDSEQSELIVLGLDNLPETKERLGRLSAAGIKVAQVGLDYENPFFNNRPYDGHPSRLAHLVYYLKIEKALNR